MDTCRDVTLYVLLSRYKDEIWRVHVVTLQTLLPTNNLTCAEGDVSGTYIGEERSGLRLRSRCTNNRPRVIEPLKIDPRNLKLVWSPRLKHNMVTRYRRPDARYLVSGYHVVSSGWTVFVYAIPYVQALYDSSEDSTARGSGVCLALPSPRSAARRGWL